MAQINTRAKKIARFDAGDWWGQCWGDSATAIVTLRIAAAAVAEEDRGERAAAFRPPQLGAKPERAARHDGRFGADDALGRGAKRERVDQKRQRQDERASHIRESRRPFKDLLRRGRSI